MKTRDFGPGIPLPDFRPLGSTSGDEENAPRTERVRPREDEQGAQPVPENSAGLSVGRLLQTIDVRLIDPNPLAPRQIYTSAMILQRAESLREYGQHDPIHVIPNPEAPGRYVICDGWTRVLACVQHKCLTTLLAEIHPTLSIRDAAWYGYEQNESRQQHCDLDRAAFYDKLQADGETQAEISRRTGISKSLLSYYRSYSQLPEEVLNVVQTDPEKFSATVVYHLRRLCDACGVRRALSLATKFAEQNQPQRWLINQVQVAVEPNKTAKVATLKHIRFANGSYKRTDGAFHLSITLPEEQQAEFEERLEALLATVAVKLEPSSRRESDDEA